jgi:hypothetical protein
MLCGRRLKNSTVDDLSPEQSTRNTRGIPTLSEVFPAIPTPSRENSDVDYEYLQSNCETVLCFIRSVWRKEGLFRRTVRESLLGNGFLV